METDMSTETECGFLRNYASLRTYSLKFRDIFPSEFHEIFAKSEDNNFAK
jgi:hypothetical protein